jgi:hypothetical protein
MFQVFCHLSVVVGNFALQSHLLQFLLYFLLIIVPMHLIIPEVDKAIGMMQLVNLSLHQNSLPLEFGTLVVLQDIGLVLGYLMGYFMMKRMKSMIQVLMRDAVKVILAEFQAYLLRLLAYLCIFIPLLSPS